MLLHNKMDKFPDTFNRKNCNDTMEKNQLDLIKQVRKDFYEISLRSINDCEQQIILPFPDKLWHEHKLTIIGELLEKFGKLKVKTINPQCDIIKSITSVEDVPASAKKILIEFKKDE